MTLPAATQPAARSTPQHGRLAFACALIALAATWLVALPWLATTKPIAAHSAELERAGIDAGAMFYTELEIAPAIAHKAERRLEAGGLRFEPSDRTR